MKRVLKKHFGLILFGGLICTVQMVTTTRAQLLKGDILNEAISKEQSSLMGLIIALVAITIISVIFTYIYGIFKFKFGQATTRSLREAFFKSILDRGYGEYKELPEGEVIAKYTKQINQLEEGYFSKFALLAQMIMKILFVLVTLIELNLFLAIASFIILSFPIIVPRLFEKRVSKAQKKRMKETESHISELSSWLKGFEVIKNYGIEKNIKKLYKNSNDTLLKLEEDAENIKSAGVGVSFGSSMIAQVGIAGIGAFLVLRGRLSAGDFLAVMSLISLLSVPLFWIAKLYQEVIATGPIRESLSTFIWGNIENRAIGDVVISNAKVPEIEYREVSFEYKNDEPIIERLNLTLNAGGHYLVTGPSGCGKSTAINLLLGYFEPKNGEILIDGISNKKIKELNDKITVSRQEAQLFQDTVRNNLTMYDSKIREGDIIDILKKVGLGRFASKEALNQMVKEEGGNLSGGEKKRLSLARALLRKSPIMILDEPLANVDPENVGRIEDLLLSLENSTVIIISHQFSTDKLKKFDEVIKFHTGGVINEAIMA